MLMGFVACTYPGEGRTYPEESPRRRPRPAIYRRARRTVRWRVAKIIFHPRGRFVVKLIYQFPAAPWREGEFPYGTRSARIANARRERKGRYMHDVRESVQRGDLS